MEINRGANRKCYEAVSFTSASSSCSHFSNCYGGKKALFLEVQKKSEAGNFWTCTRETLQWPCKVTWGCGTDRWGVSTSGIKALCSGPWSVLLASYTTADENNWACSTSFRWCFWKPGLAYGLHFQSKHSLPSTNVVWTLNTQLVKLWKWKTLPQQQKV